MVRVSAPAKVNLYLRVLGRRPDGYHDIETLFERIDLADELTFEPADALTLTCDDPSLSCGEDNLILKAARLLKETSGTAHGVRIHLVKRIPIASGLGGGSSDAAATLLGLTELWGLGCSQAELLRLAAELGADVPFFVWRVPFAVGRGRGDRCEPVEEPLPTVWHVLVVPDARLSTRAIYEGLSERVEGGQFNLTAHAPSITMCLHALRNGSVDELVPGLHNALEPEAIRRCSLIGTVQSQLLAAGCLSARVSGSGPAVFGVCRDPSHAEEAAQHLLASQTTGWFIRVIRTERSRATLPAQSAPGDRGRAAGVR